MPAREVISTSAMPRVRFETGSRALCSGRASSYKRSFQPRLGFAEAACLKALGDERPSRALLTKWDHIKGTLQNCLIDMKVQVPFLADEIMKFVPLYAWTDCAKTKEVNVSLLHLNTIAANSLKSFGAVLGERLDTHFDHIVSVKLEEGIEFGLGVCNKKNQKMDARRDFMCEKGGWGYYNYKVKNAGMKPKYPPGWYAETHSCVKRQDDAKILQLGDVLTMVISREGVGSDGRGRGTGKFSIRYYKNGKCMEFAFNGLRGPLALCCNFYFMESSIRILSDYKLRRAGRSTRLRLR